VISCAFIGKASPKSIVVYNVIAKKHASVRQVFLVYRFQKQEAAGTSSDSIYIKE
jgi:hypothetical protein